MAPEEGDVGFEEGMSWLPSHVLREVCDIKGQLRQQEQQRYQHQQHHRRPAFPAQTPPTMHFKYASRSKVAPIRPIGGPGMQAVFLKSGNRLGGTGVFLPSTAGSKFYTNKKPAISPVLLPSRVVEALNLNVHAFGLGLSTSTRKDKKSDSCGVGEFMSLQNKMAKNDDVSSPRSCILTHSQNSSAELYLPKEWSY